VDNFVENLLLHARKRRPQALFVVSRTFVPAPVKPLLAKAFTRSSKVWQAQYGGVDFYRAAA
jgi:hypothetical protein